MGRGVLAGTAAGLLWGLAFVLPDLAPGWSAVSVTVGRYLVYGLLSLAVVAVTVRRGPASTALLRRHWRPALAYAVTGNVGYYLLLVIAIQGAGAPVAATVVGSIPVVMAIAANLREGTYAWRHLAGPMLLVAVGLGFVNVPQLAAADGSSTGATMIGLGAAVLAVATWTSYGLANAVFLRRNPEVGGSEWSSAIGALTGPLALLLVPVALLVGPTTGSRDATVTGAGALLAVSLVLGLAVSWLGTALWNAASAALSTTLAGLLITVETVAGYTYSYIHDARLPPPVELVGFALVVAGVVVTTALPRQRSAEASAETWSSGGS
ncbi:DMT family transporter [Nocardioides sp. 503]|uniref:DMT family transporter n=1 Tax=Nocardioides sp. 503 TaxID=2508326 RepID=UPI00142F406C|nr:DMT family transporter [Nocardioides sp. 503]